MERRACPRAEAPRGAVTRLDIHPAALDEFEEAAAWYEARRRGLGVEFAAEVDRLMALVQESPLRAPSWTRDPTVRRALARRFPYSIFYCIDGERVVVIA